MASRLVRPRFAIALLLLLGAESAVAAENKITISEKNTKEQNTTDATVTYRQRSSMQSETFGTNPTDGRIYVDKWLSETEKDQWGHPSGVERKIHIRVTGPSDFNKGIKGDLQIELEPSDPQGEYIRTFDMAIISSEGFLKCSPRPFYEIVTDESGLYREITDLSTSQRRGYQWASTIAEMAIDAIPFVGSGYQISQGLSKTYDLIKANEKDWESMWKYTADYDCYPIPKPILSTPSDWGILYRIRCPIEVLGDEGTITLLVKNVSVHPVDGSVQSGNTGVAFQPQSFALVSGDLRASSQTSVEETEEREIIEPLTISGHGIDLRIKYRYAADGVSSKLIVSFAPECKKEKDGARLEDVNMAVVMAKNSGKVTALPVFRDFKNRHTKWMTERERLSAEAVVNWMSMAASPIGIMQSAMVKGKDAKALLSLAKTTGGLWSAFAKKDESVSFSEQLERIWENQNIQDVFHLPSIANHGSILEQPKSSEGFSVEIPINLNSSENPGCFVMFSATVNGETYIDLQKSVPSQNWKGEIGLCVFLAASSSQARVGDTSSATEALDSNANERTDMIYVQGGQFQMGSKDDDYYEKPVHLVAVRSFYIGEHEVSVAQYREYCNETGRAMPKMPSWGWIDNSPIVNVSWKEAVAYCQWAGGRLPTEAEWEYAAKGGNKSRGFRYSGSDNVDEVAWYDGNCEGRAHSVEMKLPNELGICDMSGNVWEWCSDWCDKNYYENSPSSNPTGPASGHYRILRGGAWGFMEADQYVASRNWGIPDLWDDSIGFRVVQNAK